MKHLKLISFIALLTLLIYGCESKNDTTDQLNDGQITMEIDGKNFKSVSIDKFDNLSDTSNWNLYPGGKLSIDTVNKFNGESSIKLITETECFIVEGIKGVTVSKDKVYVIHFYYKMKPIQIGDRGFCVGPCMIRLKQGSEQIFMDGLSGVNDWTEKYFYFQPKNDIPVKVELLIGTDKGVWLDDLIVLEAS